MEAQLAEKVQVGLGGAAEKMGGAVAETGRSMKPVPLSATFTGGKKDDNNGPQANPIPPAAAQGGGG
jgi:hypothetical protein